MFTHTRLLLTAALLASVSLPARAETVYVSNEKDNSVSVIDGESLKVTSTIKTGRRPRGISELTRQPSQWWRRSRPISV